MVLNPKLKDFLDEQPEGKTVVGFAWSLVWRLNVMVMFWYLVVVIGILILAKIFE